MSHFYPVHKPGVAAYIRLGNKRLGVCKELSLSLQISRDQRNASKVVRLIRPVNQRVQHRDVPPNP
jgi:hypothetical protein